MVGVAEVRSTIGGGSLPGQQQPSAAIVLDPPGVAVDELARRLRTGSPGVFGRIEDDRLLLDLRTVLPEQDDDVAHAVAAAINAGASPSRSESP